MFDIGFSEILLLAIISLVVLGPERLPHAARLAGAWIGKARRIFFDLKHEIESEIHTKEIQDRLNKIQQQLHQSTHTLTNLPTDNTTPSNQANPSDAPINPT
jgi:sec-independent protein translocase protein TatB